MRFFPRSIAAALVAVAAFSGVAEASKSPTVERIKKNGFLRCGVNEGLTGFASPDAKGNWSGFDIDFCRALAAVILNDASKVRYTPTSAKVRFTALQSGEFDILSRNTTWTMSRDVQLGLEFIAATYYDGQGFMVPKSLKVTSAKQLNGATVCTNTGTTTELNLADYFRANNLKYKIVAFEKNAEVLAAYDNGRCDAYTTDASGLYAERLKLKTPADHVILPEIISKEPLGPAINHGDQPWGDVARWTLFALINAEELGVTSKNVDQMMKSPNPEIRRLLGVEGAFGESLGLSKDWAARAIRQVGNYGEIFERNVGPNSALKLPRGLNNQWNKGGIMYAPPIR